MAANVKNHKKTILGSSAGKKHWEAAWKQYWEAILGSNTGNQYWEAILGKNTGKQCWEAILGSNAGEQYWKKWEAIKTPSAASVKKHKKQIGGTS